MLPSFISQIFSGLILLFALYYLYVNFDTYRNDTYKVLIILLGLSIAISLHGLQHAYQEVYYNYNPLDFSRNECRMCRKRPCMCNRMM